jgi:hypothetical protein
MPKFIYPSPLLLLLLPLSGYAVLRAWIVDPHVLLSVQADFF